MAKENEMKFSIVTVSLNQCKFLEENIKSILGQKYPNFEHIIIDGGSTDGTVELLKRYPHIRWISEKDSGQSNAMNKGLRMVTGDIVYILNSDDVCEPGSFESVSKFFSGNPDAKIVYGNCRIIDENGNEISIDITEEFDLKRHLNIGNMIWQEATFFRKEVLGRIGLMNEKYRYAMDYDLWCRAAKFYKFYRINRILGNFRVHSTTKTFFANEDYRKETYAVSIANGGSRVSPIFLSRYWAKMRRLVGDERFSKMSKAYNDAKLKVWKATNKKR